jgi:hypothetical protein
MPIVHNWRTYSQMLRETNSLNDVRLGSKTEVAQLPWQVRSTFPEERTSPNRSGWSGSCNSGSDACYSITSSARASSAGGIVRASLFAVLRLITNSNLAGSMTGRSVGLAPLRMRPT